MKRSYFCLLQVADHLRASALKVKDCGALSFVKGHFKLDGRPVVQVVQRLELDAVVISDLGEQPPHGCLLYPREHRTSKSVARSEPTALLRMCSMYSCTVPSPYSLIIFPISWTPFQLAAIWAWRSDSTSLRHLLPEQPGCLAGSSTRSLTSSSLLYRPF